MDKPDHLVNSIGLYRGLRALDAKKPDFFESGFLVFGAMVRYTVGWPCAYSSKESHNKVLLMLFNGIHWALRWSWRSFVRGYQLLNLRYGEQVGTVRLIALLYLRQQKTRCIAATGFSNLNPGNDLLSHNKCYTIIGAVSFHYWVRHGVRWVQNAIVTKKILFNFLIINF